MAIRHLKISTKTDISDGSIVRPSDWNADHIVTDNIEFNGHNITTSGSTFAITLNDSTTPNVALNLGTSDPGPGYSVTNLMDFGTTDFPALTLMNSSNLTGGPSLVCYQNSNSPAANDSIGQFAGYGKDSAGNVQFYGAVTFTIVDPTSTSEDSKILFDIMSLGSDVTALTLGATGQFNGFGNVMDFDGNALGALYLTNSSSGAFDGPGLIVKSNSSSPAANDLVGYIDFVGKDTGGNDTLYAAIHHLLLDPTDGSEDAGLRFYMMQGGSVGAGNDPDLALWVLDTGNGNTGHTMSVGGDNGSTFMISNHSSGTLGPIIGGYQKSSSPAASDQVAAFAGYGRDSAANFQLYGYIGFLIDDPTSTSEDSHIDLVVQSNGSVATPLQLSGSVGNFSVPVQFPSFAKASLPSASTAGRMIYVTDDIGGAVPAFSDGTNWRRVTDRNVIS